MALPEISNDIASTAPAKQISYIWYTVTCVAGAVVSFGSYVGGLYTNTEAAQLENRLGARIQSLENHQEMQSLQLLEIAKTVGAKTVLQSSTQPTSKP